MIFKRSWLSTVPVCIILLALAFVSCHHPDDPPPPPPEPDPGKRDYVWSLDTLNHPDSYQTDMEDIWASSPTNVYVVGQNDRASTGVMYRYRGAGWMPVKLHVLDGGLINTGFELHAIYGFDTARIWSVGYKLRSNPNPPPNFFDSTFIIWFDGTAWREEPMERKRGQLLAIWGANAGDVWAGGTNGNLYHYTLGTWARRRDIDSTVFVLSIRGFATDDIYMTSARSLAGPDSAGYYMVYLNHWNGQIWERVDSFANVSGVWKFGRYLLTTDGHQLLSSLYGIYRYNGGCSWSSLLQSEQPLRIQGSSSKNIYGVGDYWRVFHWNGTDWRQIPTTITDMGLFTGVWSDNKETFIIGHNGRVTYIMHGK